MPLEFDPLNHDYKIELDKATHTYRVDGEVKPGYHEICDCVGTRRRCCECYGIGCDQCNNTGYTSYRAVSGSEFMRDQIAARFGTHTHDFIAFDQRGIKCKYDPGIEPYIAGYRKFLKNYNLEMQLVEEMFYHKFYGYCITIDWFGFLHIEKPKTKVPLLIDWKTSTTVQKSWARQTAAQEEAIKFNLKLTYRKIHRMAVLLKPNDYEPIEHKRSELNQFLSILNTYKTFGK